MIIRHILSYIVLGVFPIYETGSYALFWWKKEKLSLKKRNTRMIKYASGAAWLAYINLFISLFDGIPCGVYFFILLLVTPMCVGPQLLRVIILRGLSAQHRLMMEEENLKLMHRNSDKATNGMSIIREDQSANASSSELNVSNREETNYSKTQSSMKLKISNQKKQTKIRLKLTCWGLIIMPTVLLVISLFSFSSKENILSRSFEECFPEPQFIIYISRGIGALTALKVLLSTAFIRDSKDELGILAEINRNVLILFIIYIIIIISSILGYEKWQALLQCVQQMMLTLSMIILPSIQNSNHQITLKKNRRSMIVAGYGQPIQSNAQHKKLSISRRVSQKDIEANMKRTREATMSLDAGLCILLSTKEGIKTFTEHCAREFSVENIMFWCAVNEFRSGVDKTRDPEKEDDSDIVESDLKEFANEIFSRYIQVNSDLQINISSKLRQDIEKKLKSDETVDRKVFDSSQKEIFALMSRGSYPRFLSSKHHEQSRTFNGRRGTIIPSGTF